MRAASPPRRRGAESAASRRARLLLQQHAQEKQRPTKPPPPPIAVLSQRARAGSPPRPPAPPPRQGPHAPPQHGAAPRRTSSPARARSSSPTRRLAAFLSAAKRGAKKGGPEPKHADLSGMTAEQLKAEEEKILAELEELGWVECQVTGEIIRRADEQRPTAEDPVEETFRSMDVNNSGAVCTSEIKRLVAAKGWARALDPAYVDGLVAAYDLDGSGEIRLDELRKIHAVLERKVQGGLRSASNAVARRPSLGAPRLPFPPARATILV